MKLRFIVYRISDANGVFYVGRTMQTLKARMRQHMTNTKGLSDLPHINPADVKKIEFAMCNTEADMIVYETYYINKHHPKLNVDAKAEDVLTISLPELNWKPYMFHTELQEWRMIYESSQMDQTICRQKAEHLDNLLAEYERKFADGLLTNDEYLALVNQSVQIYANQIGESK